jgi:hypothetical protein
VWWWQWRDLASCVSLPPIRPLAGLRRNDPSVPFPHGRADTAGSSAPASCHRGAHSGEGRTLTVGSFDVRTRGTTGPSRVARRLRTRSRSRSWDEAPLNADYVGGPAAPGGFACASQDFAASRRTSGSGWSRDQPWPPPTGRCAGDLRDFGSPESWRASLCGFPVGAAGVLVGDGAHHAGRAVPAVVVVEPVAPVQHNGLGLAGALELVS